MTRIEKGYNRIAEYGCQIDELSLNSKFEELKSKGQTTRLSLNPFLVHT